MRRNRCFAESVRTSVLVCDLFIIYIYIISVQKKKSVQINFGSVFSIAFLNIFFLLVKRKPSIDFDATDTLTFWRLLSAEKTNQPEYGDLFQRIVFLIGCFKKVFQFTLVFFSCHNFSIASNVLCILSSHHTRKNL